MLSPEEYLRCSENSTENPWNGLAWRPEMKPSTINLARRSSRATWRITSGFRYFSAVPATKCLLALDQHEPHSPIVHSPPHPGRKAARSSFGATARAFILGRIGL